MLLQHLTHGHDATNMANEAMQLIESLFPICRSITGDGVRQTLDRLEPWIPLERTEVPSGTQVYDWEIPREWNIRDAYIADAQGQRVVDFQAHNLHVMGYSVPVRCTLSLEDLQPHLHSLPEHPDRIPYRTSYYREQWGFCLRHRDRERMGPGPFEVVIDADLAAGYLTYAESTIPGSTAGGAVVYTHTCHPSLANDNLTGIAVAAALARELHRSKPRLTWRFIFGPGTIGSLAWLSRNEARLPAVKAGLVVGLLGDSGPLTYKRSRRGDTLVDRVAHLVVPAAGGREVDFEPYGYDERQFCSPGFDLPFGRLTRSPNGAYAQYHSSADDLDIVKPAALSGAIQALASMIGAIDANQAWRNLSPKGEPRLGKRNLYGDVGGSGPAVFEQGLLWLLNQSDGTRDLIDIASRSGLPIDVLERGAAALVAADLLSPVSDMSTEPRIEGGTR